MYMFSKEIFMFFIHAHMYIYIYIYHYQRCTRMLHPWKRWNQQSSQPEAHHPNIPTGATIISRFVGVIPCYSTFFVAKSPWWWWWWWWWWWCCCWRFFEQLWFTPHVSPMQHVSWWKSQFFDGEIPIIRWWTPHVGWLYTCIYIYKSCFICVLHFSGDFLPFSAPACTISTRRSSRQAFMKKQFGNSFRAWRHALDLDGSMNLQRAELFKASPKKGDVEVV